MVRETGVDAAQLRIQGELTSVLEKVEAMGSHGNRQMIADMLSDALPERIFLKGEAGRLQLLELVRACVKWSNGLEVLIECITALDPRAPEMPELIDLCDEWAALRALPTRDWDGLRDELRAVRLGHDPMDERRRLRELLRAATGGRFDDLPPRRDTVWSLFLHLADVNSSPDNLPPAMIFIACLAEEVEDKALAEKLLRWRWRWAEQFGVHELVERAQWRGEPAAKRRDDLVYLVFELDPDPIDQQKVILSHWRQWDGPGWRPQRMGDVPVRREDLESEIDQVIGALEVELGTTPEGVRAGSIVIEFVVPWEMINMPVELWRKASMSTDMIPLAVDHPVVLRSLERMRNQRFLLAWKQRWNALVAQSSSVQPYWSQANHGNDYTKMAIDLRTDDTIVSLVLSEPPGDRTGQAWREAAVAFQAGIPVIIWDRHDCSNTDFHEAVMAMLADGLITELPHRLARLRQEALSAPEEKKLSHAGHSLAVLWDDADRLPEPLTTWWSSGSLGGSG